MALSPGIYPDLSVTELAEAVQAKSDQRQLLWRYLGSIALIVATVGMATEVAHWTR